MGSSTIKTTADQGGTTYSLTISNITASEEITLLYNPIVLVTLEKPNGVAGHNSVGKGTATTEFYSFRRNVENNLVKIKPLYSQVMYPDGWSGGSNGTSSQSYSMVYNATNSISTGTINRDTSISNIFEINHESTGNTYVFVVYHGNGDNGLYYKTTLTPYIENTSAIETSERYIPHEIKYTKYTSQDTAHFQVKITDNNTEKYVDYENLSSGVYNNALINESLRESYYSSNTLTVSDNNIYQDKNSVTPSFAREYTIEFSTYLSNASDGTPASLILKIGTSTYTIPTGDIYYKNVHVLEGEETTIQVLWDDDKFDNLYNQTQVYDSNAISVVDNVKQDIQNYNTSIENKKESMQLIEKENEELRQKVVELNSQIEQIKTDVQE